MRALTSIRFTRPWVLCLLTASLGTATARAESSVTPEDTTARYQMTYNWQRHPGFATQGADGPNSLSSSAERMYTFSATAHWGMRPWAGGELYFNPELIQGVPFSHNLVGLGGFTNGEITRAGGSEPKLYRQRLFVRQTWGRGGGTEDIDADFNQLASRVDKNRWVLTAGNFSVLDVFDDNAYAKDPRTQFMNWSHWTYGAYDYAADSRGYGWGAALAWHRDNWVLRFARMTGPKEPNGLPVDFNLARHYGDQFEVERAHQIGEQPGKLRVLLWRNRARLASFEDARQWWLAQPLAVRQSITGPDALVATRTSDKTKYGLGVNVEQSLREDIGWFMRAMTTDGRTETYAFTEIDRSFSTGLLVQGKRWARAQDSVGLAWGHNALSAERRDFLAAGGISFFLGDGRLSYRPETVLEAFYSLQIGQGSWLTANHQRIQNPGYNAQRGPVQVYAFRFHAEF